MPSSNLRRRSALAFLAGVLIAPPILPHLEGSAAAATTTTFAQGVYAGSGAAGVTGTQSFDSQLHVASTESLDFPPTSSWSQIEGQSWLLSPHAAAGARLEYSVPIVPSITGASLAQCAAGAYNSHWAALASNLIHYGLANTIVRPGWEMNGTWYAWSAAANPAAYIDCFRHVVTTMRKAPGQHFSFDFNPNNNRGSFPAELAYPGDAYVDIIGDDVYDTSWVWYAAGTTVTPTAQAKAIAYDISGDHGLAYWASFAIDHHKHLAVTEWGLCHRSDGHGGEDDPQYVQALFNFMANPAHAVAYEHYFNTAAHQLTAPTPFPNSARTFTQLFGPGSPTSPPTAMFVSIAAAQGATSVGPS